MNPKNEVPCVQWWYLKRSYERETRFELATLSLEGWCSTNWATPAFFGRQMYYFYLNIKSYLSFIPKMICGESRIRTYEGEAIRFTVWPRWPLEYLPNFKISKSRWRDSNPRPADYKSAALASWATSALLKIQQKKDLLSKKGLQMYKRISFIHRNRDVFSLFNQKFSFVFFYLSSQGVNCFVSSLLECFALLFCKKLFTRNVELNFYDFI